MDCRRLAAALRADHLVAIVRDPTDDLPVERVDVTFLHEATGTRFVTQIVAIPTELDGGFGLVQLFTPAPVDLSSEVLAQLQSALGELNRLAPLPGFTVDEGVFFHRYVAVVPEGEGGDAVVCQAAWLVRFAVEGVWSLVGGPA